jgi:hypothetical protein
MRVLIAGLLGGLAMFVWTSISHVLTPLGFIGFSQMPAEQAVIDTAHASIGDKSGLYIFPYADPNDPKMMEIVTEKSKTGPSGLVVYHAPGEGAEMMPGTLVAEFLKETAQALIAAFLVSLMIPLGFAMRVGAVVLIGVSAAIATNVSYWIWYGFPLDYTLAQIFIELVGAAFAGVAIAYWLGRKAVTA